MALDLACNAEAQRIGADESVSRRGLLGRISAMAAAGLLGASGTARASPPEVAADLDPESLVPKLVRRITFGATDAEVTRAYGLGYDRYLDEQLKPDTIPEFDSWSYATRVNQYYTYNAGALPTTGFLGLTPAQLTDPAWMPTVNGRVQTLGVADQLVEMTILRAAYSKRQLFERMVEFWTDHFNIDLRTSDDMMVLKTVNDRDVIRANAIGTFRDLLGAMVRSPAMLHYLANDLSTATQPNENLARELMELHTLGSGGGYTQDDVVNVARCLTGWGRYSRETTNGALANTFRYQDAQYHNSQKTVLGQVIPNLYALRAAPDFSDGLGEPTGMRDAKTVIGILVNHPSTRLHIARKLCRRFLNENVSQATIEQVAAAWGDDGDIKGMLRVMLQPRNLAAAPPKFKRPFHLFISAARATGATLGQNITDLSGSASNRMRTRLYAAGHHPFYWSPPDGYPDRLSYWSASLMPRWNFGAALVVGDVVNCSIYPGFFNVMNTPAQVLSKIQQLLFQGEWTQAEWDQVSAYINDTTVPNTFDQRRKEAVGLALACPTFQWC